MIGHKRIPSREGGVEIVVEELSTRMAILGHHVDIYNRYYKKVKTGKGYKGTRIIVIPTINKKSLDALVYSFLATIEALFRKYDVIHYHAEGPCAMLWIPHLFHIRTVATIHGLDWQRAKWGRFATSYLKFGEKIAAKYADEVIVLSKNVQQYFLDTYGRDTQYIPNGVNIVDGKETDIITKKYDLTKDNYILFLARLVPEKGLHYLLEAFKNIDTDKKLVIAGASSHSNDYVKKIKNMAKNDDRVIMTGFVQGKELEELYSNCYLYVLPSDVEGMPLSLLEALSYGCRCLVSDIEENCEVAKKYATTFKYGNVMDLGKQLAEILRSKKHHDNKLQLEYVKKYFGWNNVVRNTIKSYIGDKYEYKQFDKSV
ncbi:glycosyltransferase family 4 protein [Clostridium lacusfryxellense]|nr:glycosyltransferase family 4 protein [Clostridium lacusfryxellense]